MIRFYFMDKNDFHMLAKEIFSILWSNMLTIAPTGNSYEDDFNSWFQAVERGLLQKPRKIILINHAELIGFFQYYTNENRLMMEEIQIQPDWQGKKVFRDLYGFLLEALPREIQIVEAYANKRNVKSQAILRRLGLDIAGENRKGDSYLFRGRYSDLVKWYERHNRGYRA